MSTLKTHNLQSSDSGSVNIALTPNAGMIVTGITTFTGAIDANGDLDVDGHTDLDNVSISGVSTTTRLDINSTTPIINFLESDGNPDYRLYAESGAFVIRDQTSVANRLVINSAGAILFGTTVHSNAENLHIHTASSDKALIKLTNSTTGTGTGDGFEFGLNGSEQIEFVNKENTDMFFATNNAERLRITSGGEIQVGTSDTIYLKYSGNATPTNNNNATLLGNSNIGLIGQYSTLNQPFDHSTATTSGSWWMLGRAAGTTNQWGLNTRGGGTSNLLSVWKVKGESNGNVDYQSFSTSNAQERFRITSYGDVYATNSAYNTYDTAATSVNTVVEANENRSGVYWLNFNSVKFRAYVKANWLQGRNWVLAAKYFDPQDMPSGSSLWTNDTYVNESDFNLYGGLMSKYRSWRYFSFNRLAMQMGNRIPPIMQFNSNQTLFGAFSGGYASNGGGVTANSTDPAMSGTSVAYHSMNNYAGPDFHDVGGSEDRIQSYGLNKWANNAANSTSGNNQGSENYYPQHRIEAGGSQSTEHSIDSESVKGFRMTIEDSHPNLTGVDSLGRAGAWIGCPLDEGSSQQGSAGSNVGADSGFGMGGCSGNNARTWTSGYAEWNLGNSVVNCLPAYIWLSID